MIEVASNATMSSKTNHLSDVLFGSVAGFTGKFVEYPFDTVKVRLQTGNVYSGAMDCISKMWSREGVKSFYQGLSAPLIGSMIENSALFVAYNQVQRGIRHFSINPQAELSMNQLCLAGALSGALVSFVLTPVELIKCKLQVQGMHNESLVKTDPAYNFQAKRAFGLGGHLREPPPNKKFSGPISVIAYTIKNQGFSGLFRGHLATVLRESTGGAAWFGTYEWMIKLMVESTPNATKKSDLSPWPLMFAGACAGMSYNAILFPADVIKSRQQSSDERVGFIKASRDLYRAHGIGGFYRGFAITIARSAPSSAVIFATYELLTRHMIVEFD